mgnify:CR=1 FL=1
MTVFTSTFPLRLVERVWDSFLCEGWIVVYRTVLAVLEHIQEELLIRSSEQISPFIRRFQPIVDVDSVLMLSSKIPLKQHHIQEHAAKFRKLTESGEIQVVEVPQRRFASPESIDGYSISSSRTKVANINKAHRFISKLKHSINREITVEDHSAKMTSVIGSSKLVVVLNNVLSPEECIGLIKRSKFELFEDVLMRQPGEFGENVCIANCRRSVVDDLDLASELFDRLATALHGTDLEVKLQHAPWISEGDTSALNATGLNDRLHFLRYGINQFFAPHRDSRYRRETGKSIYWLAT